MPPQIKGNDTYIHCKTKYLKFSIMALFRTPFRQIMVTFHIDYGIFLDGVYV